jgi:hypothetical protein
MRLLEQAAFSLQKGAAQGQRGLATAARRGELTRSGCGRP